MDRGILQLVSRSLAERKRRRVPSSSSSPTRFFKRVILFSAWTGLIHSSLHPGGSPYWASIHTSKIAKNKLRFSSLFVRQEFNFRAHFFFKNHKMQKSYFCFTPTYRGTPLSWWQGPPLFSFGLLSTMGITFWDRNKISCPVNLRGVGNDFSITFLCFQDTTPTFCKRGGSFCILADMKRHGEEGRPSTTAERKIELGLAVCRAVFPQPLQRTDLVAFRN